MKTEIANQSKQFHKLFSYNMNFTYDGI